MALDLNRLSASELRMRLQTRELSALQVAESCLARIADRDNVIHAWAHIDPQRLRAAAKALDAGPVRGPLHGLPLGVKDIFDTCDSPTAYGSPIYAGRVPAADAACVALARAAGALVFGKTMSTEFATYAPAPTVNPRNFAHTPGGSSSGSAAAVADEMVPFAFGTQTAGSIIRPASFCGTIGYKPTFGWIARAGVKLVAESLDTVGVFARSVEDSALLVGALTSRRELIELRAADGPIRIGICRTRDWRHADTAVADVLGHAEQTLAAAGAVTATVELPDDFDALGDAFDAIYGYEIAQNLAYEYSVHRDCLSESLRRTLEFTPAIAPDRYDRAQLAADEWRRKLSDVFGRSDVLLAPSACGEAPEGLTSTGSPVLNRMWTLLHVPCVNVPAGVGGRDLPIGLQVVGRRRDDARTLAAAAWIARELAAAAAEGLRLA
jgi:Asp-tRNA(Asn)/Glu-tRNA(Gln) amidotransferase A subunit family amidase